MTRTRLFVEGGSDANALATLARRRGRDLRAEGVDVVALDGVTNIGRSLTATANGTRVAGLCDAGEQRLFQREFDAASERLVVLGYFVCVPDLESELIAAAGIDRVVAVIEREGESDGFRTLQRQPAQRDRTLEQQLHRFLGSKSGRKLRYASLLVDMLDLAVVPRPLDGVLAAVAFGD